MESKRQLKFSRLIQKDLADIFQRDAKGMFGGAFITVTRVGMSPDLGVAKVHVSILAVQDREATLSKIKAQSKSIRSFLAAKIKNQVRVIPELIFYLDENVDYAMKMSSIIDDLHIPKETKIDESDYEDDLE